jgi:hypothetical protein
MRKFNAILLLVLMCAVPALGGTKLKGSATLKDLQPAGTPNKKQKQQFDFTFVASDTQYTCRTSEGTKLNAVDFPVNGDITYEIDNNNGRVKTPAGKQAKCKVVRVEQLTSTSKPDVPR